MPDRSSDKFTDLLRQLVRVPKEAIDRQEREYQKKKPAPAKRGQIVPTPKHKAG